MVDSSQSARNLVSLLSKKNRKSKLGEVSSENSKDELPASPKLPFIKQLMEKRESSTTPTSFRSVLLNLTPKADRNKENKETTGESTCPVCQLNFDPLVISTHVNACLDGKKTVSSPAAVRSTSSTIVSLVKQGQKFCPLCSRNMSGYAHARKETHVNRCLDSALLAEAMGRGKSTQSGKLRHYWRQVDSCPCCLKQWDRDSGSSISSKLRHVKVCANASGMDVLETLEFVRNLSPEGTPPPSAKEQPSTKPVLETEMRSADIEKVQVRNVKEDDEEFRPLMYQFKKKSEDAKFQKEDLDLAKAISASLKTPPKQKKSKKKEQAVATEILVGEELSYFFDTRRSELLDQVKTEVKVEPVSMRKVSKSTIWDLSTGEASSSQYENDFFRELKEPKVKKEIKVLSNKRSIKDRIVDIEERYAKRIKDVTGEYRVKIDALEKECKERVAQLHVEKLNEITLAKEASSQQRENSTDTRVKNEPVQLDHSPQVINADRSVLIIKDDEPTIEDLIEALPPTQDQEPMSQEEVNVVVDSEEDRKSNEDFFETHDMEQGCRSPSYHSMYFDAAEGTPSVYHSINNGSEPEDDSVHIEEERITLPHAGYVLITEDPHQRRVRRRSETDRLRHAMGLDTGASSVEDSEEDHDVSEDLLVGSDRESSYRMAESEASSSQTRRAGKQKDNEDRLRPEPISTSFSNAEIATTSKTARRSPVREFQHVPGMPEYENMEMCALRVL